MAQSVVTEALPRVYDRAPRSVHARRETRRFESLVNELSMVMTRAPAHTVDREIETWLGRICQVLDLDRSAIYERDAPGEPVRTTHTWLRGNFPPFPRNFDPEKLVKTSTDWIMAGNQLVFSRPVDIPVELADTRRFVEKYGPKASAIIPMWAGRRVIGAASFGKFRSTREWPPALLANLGLVVRLFGGAIERKQSEAALQAALAELRVASRRNMMSELVASLTHEINQPISAILSNLAGVARLVSDKNPDLATALAAVNNAIEDTKRTGEIIRRMRSMFKHHPEHKSAISIEGLVAEVVKLLASEAALRNITVRVEGSPSVPRVIGDSIQLQQCVVNLLMNAFDAIGEAALEPREVTINVAPEKAGWVLVRVCDTGGGIDPRIADRLFQPFITTKAEGMGLGLLVTRSIIESHGGKIWATPNRDGGTTFSFTLAVAERKRIRSSPPAR